MYISSSALMASMRISIMSTQSSLATDQTEVSSGTYADFGLQLSSRSGSLLTLTAQQNRLQAFTDGNTTATARLSATDGALTSLQSAASTFLASLTSANSTGSASTTLSTAAKDNLSSLLSTLNTTVGGKAIFGGLNTDTTPMTDYGATSAAKKAVDSAFSAAFGTTPDSAAAGSITADQMTSFLNGSFASLFSSGSYDGTWSGATDATQTTDISSSQSISTSVSANNAAFRGLAQAYTMVRELTDSSSLSTDAQQAVIASAVKVMGSAVNDLTNVQASVGLSQNAITSANDRITAQTTLLSSQVSDMTAVDPYALNTQITSLQTQLQASYVLTNSLQKLSLVNYLS